MSIFFFIYCTSGKPVSSISVGLKKRNFPQVCESATGPPQNWRIHFCWKNFVRQDCRPRCEHREPGQDQAFSLLFSSVGSWPVLCSGSLLSSSTFPPGPHWNINSSHFKFYVIPIFIVFNLNIAIHAIGSASPWWKIPRTLPSFAEVEMNSKVVSEPNFQEEQRREEKSWWIGWHLKLPDGGRASASDSGISMSWEVW